MHFTTAPLDQNLVEIVPKMVPYNSYHFSIGKPTNFFDSWLMADGTVLVLMTHTETTTGNNRKLMQTTLIHQINVHSQFTNF